MFSRVEPELRRSRIPIGAIELQYPAEPKDTPIVVNAMAIILIIAVASAIILSVCFLLALTTKGKSAEMMCAANEKNPPESPQTCSQAIRFPFLAAVIEIKSQTYDPRKQRFLCTGTIISAKWVITIAQCLTKVKRADLMIRVGSEDWASGGSTNYYISKTVRYREKEVTASIVAMKVNPPFEFSRSVQPVKLYSECDMFKPTFGGVHLAGWLRPQFVNDPNAKPMSMDSARYNIALVADDVCAIVWEDAAEMYGFCGQVKDLHICDRSVGFPLMTDDDYLVGMQGESCHYENSARTHLFVNISVFESWLWKTEKNDVPTLLDAHLKFYNNSAEHKVR